MQNFRNSGSNFGALETPDLTPVLTGVNRNRLTPNGNWETSNRNGQVTGQPVSATLEWANL